jgi:DNA primase catalytic core
LNNIEAVSRLKDETRTYLEAFGYQFNEAGYCNCPNPDHDDKTPSCHFVPGSNDTRLTCFGCSRSFDLFHLAHWFEGFPTHTKEFYSVTVAKLCERFNIPYEPPEMTEAEHYRAEAHRAYKDAAHVMAGFGINEHITQRGWSNDTCVTTLTGGVPSWNAFSAEMRKLGYKLSYLDEVDITKRLFNENSIIFTWCNRWGAPIGFSARNVDYVEGGAGNRPKYINTATKSQVFKKGEHLYGLNWARHYRPIYITEGFSDVLTPYEHGIKNVVCLGGTAMTPEHVQLLKALNIDDIVLVLDADSSGVSNTTRTLDETLAGHSGISVRVMDLTGTVPDGVKPDVDNLFKYNKHPKEVWENIPRVDAFEWRLKHFPEGTTAREIAEKAMALIVNENSDLKREELLKMVSKVTGYTFITLQNELEKLTYHERERVRSSVDTITRDLMRDMRSGDVGAVIASVMDAGKQVESLKLQFTADQHTPQDAVSYMQYLKREFHEDDGTLRGYETGFPMLDAALSGIPKMGRFIGIAGEPSSGKTSFLHALIWALLAQRKEGDNYVMINPDLCVLLFTIDDNRRIVFPRFVAIDSGLKTDQVLTPRKLNPEQTRWWELAWKRLEHLVTYAYFDVRDTSHGANLAYFEDWIRRVQSRHPEKRILAILDNFHKLEGYGVDERVKYKEASGKLHELATKLDVTFIATMELVKRYGAIAQMDHVAETKKLLYDCDAIAHIHTYMIENQDTGAFWTSPAGERLPVTRIKFWKNKVHGPQPTIWYNLDPQTSRFIERDSMPQGLNSGTSRRGMEIAAVMGRRPRSMQ